MRESRSLLPSCALSEGLRDAQVAAARSHAFLPQPRGTPTRKRSPSRPSSASRTASTPSPRATSRPSKPRRPARSPPPRPRRSQRSSARETPSMKSPRGRRRPRWPTRGRTCPRGNSPPRRRRLSTRKRSRSTTTMTSRRCTFVLTAACHVQTCTDPRQPGAQDELLQGFSLSLFRLGPVASSCAVRLLFDRLCLDSTLTIDEASTGSSWTPRSRVARMHFSVESATLRTAGYRPASPFGDLMSPLQLLRPSVENIEDTQSSPEPLSSVSADSPERAHARTLPSDQIALLLLDLLLFTAFDSNPSSLEE